MISMLLKARERNYVAVYSVYEPPVPPADPIDRAEAMMFVREGFSWGAALATPVWMAAGRMWAALAIYLAVLAVVVGGLVAAGVGTGWICLAVAALQVMTGFEGSALERLVLEVEGWKDAGTVSGRNEAECERRFFDLWLAGKTAGTGAAAST
jgi:hypothetical protein